MDSGDRSPAAVGNVGEGDTLMLRRVPLLSYSSCLVSLLNQVLKIFGLCVSSLTSSRMTKIVSVMMIMMLMKTVTMTAITFCKSQQQNLTSLITSL